MAVASAVVGAAAGDRQTPLVILLGSGGGGAVELAAERVLATLAGAVLAGAVGSLVLWLERRLRGSAAPAAGPAGVAE